MTNRQIIDVLIANKNELQLQFGVESIGLFGSFARGDQKPGSDIDILVKFKEPDFHIWCSLKRYLENNFQNQVDLITEGKHLSERFRNRVNKEIIYA